MNDDHNLTSEPNLSGVEPTESRSADDDLRYAPPVDAPNDVLRDDGEAESNLPVSEATPVPVTDELDIEAALAAVSTLSDMVAEQEAAEQARLAREELEAQLQAERQARLEHPERFYPVPPLTTLSRGQLASIVPAILLVSIGAWLTFTLTTTKTLPDAGLLAGLAVGSIALTLLAGWLSSGRWARGSLFFGLVLLFCGIIGVYLIQPGSLRLTQSWPLFVVGSGLSVIGTAWLSKSVDRRLLLPGVALIVVGIVGLVVTMNLLSGDFLTTAASLWPAALMLVVVIWLLPVIFRQRQ